LAKYITVRGSYTKRRSPSPTKSQQREDELKLATWRCRH